MPALSMFYGIIVYMHRESGERHSTPHVHARYQDFEIVVSTDGEVLDGKLPPKKLNMLLVWIDIHNEELFANWQLLSQGKEYFKIDPLK